MAKQITYAALNINAEEALRIGLVNAVYSPEELMPNALKLALKISKNAPIAVRACKQAINEGLQVSIEKESKSKKNCSVPVLKPMIRWKVWPAS